MKAISVDSREERARSILEELKTTQQIWKDLCLYPASLDARVTKKK